MQVIVFSEVKWSYMRTRKRFLLARFPASWRILFLEPMNLQAPSHWRPVRDGRVTVATLPVLKPSTTVAALNRLLGWSVFRGLINLLVAMWARVLVGCRGRGRPRVIYLSNVMCSPVARRLDRDLFLYDCNDDPLGFRTTPAWVAPYLDMTLRTADVVVSCSRSLARRLRARHEREVVVIGNGVEYEHFATVADRGRLLPVLGETEAPRIGYAGAISNWFDFELVGKVAAAHPGRPVVLMGPVAPDVAGAAQALARRHPNVRFTGAVAYEELPAQVAALTVALIPFRLGGETDVLNPNKLYEYLAAGCTVVSRRYSEDMVAFEHCVKLAADDQAFVAAVTAALAAPFEAERLRAVARDHSWDARAAAMVALIEQRLAGGAGSQEEPE